VAITEQERKKRNIERERAWRAANPEKYNARQRAYYAANRDKNKAQKRKRYTVNREKINARKKKSRFIKNYGITIERYEEMYSEQWGMCPICGSLKDSSFTPRKKTSEVLCVDHCHNSGKVRGLLCSKCNTVLGLMNDNPNFLRNAADYLDYCKELHSLSLSLKGVVD